MRRHVLDGDINRWRLQDELAFADGNATDKVIRRVYSNFRQTMVQPKDDEPCGDSYLTLT
jgi:hypothetical protein